MLEVYFSTLNVAPVRGKPVTVIGLPLEVMFTPSSLNWYVWVIGATGAVPHELSIKAIPNTPSQRRRRMPNPSRNKPPKTGTTRITARLELISATTKNWVAPEADSAAAVVGVRVNVPLSALNFPCATRTSLASTSPFALASLYNFTLVKSARSLPVPLTLKVMLES